KATSLITTHTGVVYDLVKTPVIIDSFVRAYSSVNITHAKVTISSGFSAGDLLGYAAASLPPGVTAAYNAVTGVLSFTGTATAANWQTLFRTINFSSSSSSFVNRVATFSAGNMVAAGNGHFYEEVPVATDWFTAKADAAARTHLGLQGYLATITSQSENDFVLGKLSANGWIGGSDHYAEINVATGATTFASQAAAEGNWYWVTGPEAGTQFSVNNHTPTQLTYMNWNTGEPNNLGGNEHHAHYYATGNRAGRWNDEPSYFSKNFVVEYGGMEGDPILQLSDNRTIIVVTTLPVTGLKFHIVRNGSAALLNWSTESENNTRNYHVLHSTNGREFTKIGEVAGAQHSAVQKKYSFQHNNPANGCNYYKLQIIDIDGKNDFSPIRELKTGATEMSVSPNPVVSQMIVHHPFIKSGVLLIKNSIGAIMLRQNIFNNQTPVDVSVFAPGVYFAEVTDTQQHSTKIKFVKKQM
ncbi:MAG TPA: T9SS type A sorting domain-containing protein, partial [Flavisolibacter sp.]|nr:T9SS type A sorting domain-containing protein [Flavisolibacter sp.]